VICRGGAARPAGRCSLPAFALLCLTVLSAMGQNAGLPAGSDSAQARTVVVVVPGNAAWTDTGLEVSAGDVFSFEAEGQITLQKGNPEAECGPDGYDLQTLQQPLTGRNLGSLIGKVVIAVTVTINEKTKEERQEETAELFYVGSKSRVEMPAKGRLFLGINENVIGDNGGEFRVTVSVPASDDGSAGGERRPTSSGR
jgi:hypothetical protein